MKTYSGRRLHQYNNACRENTSVVVSSIIPAPMGFSKKEYVLTPFYGDTRRFDMPFDWTEKALSFGVLHLSMSILADNIESYTPEFPEEHSDLIYDFASQVVSKFGYEQWVITEDDIDGWLENRYNLGI